MSSNAIKSHIRRSLPQATVERLQDLAHTAPRLPLKARARRAFLSAGRTPEFLDADALPELVARYRPPPEYGYDAQAVAARGEERARQLMRMPAAKQARSVLELGCWDGMVSAALARRGKQATAVDRTRAGFDERARAAGVALHGMDAARLSFGDACFDFVFSYDAFEHFPSPEAVLRECIRVTRPGGHVYLEFGPLYASAFGLHAYRIVPVPYCQFLFSRPTLDAFVASRGLEPIDHASVNGLSLAAYRGLWRRYAAVLQVERCHEGQNLSHLDLIRRYPSCFRSQIEDFEELAVSSISVLFRKIGPLGGEAP